MIYGDEKVISLRSANRDMKEHSIENEVEIQGVKYTFARTTFEEYGISSVIPKGFGTMPEEMAKRKYISEERPKLILMDESSTINFTIKDTDIELGKSMLLKQLADFKSAIKNLQPSNLFYDIEMIPNEAVEIGYLDYVSYAIDGKLYNLIFIVSVNDKLLLGTFSCPDEPKFKWKPLVIQILSTIELLSKNGEVNHGS